MTINVKNALKNPGDSFPLAAELSFPPEDFQGEVVFSSVHLDASYCCIGGNIELKGTVSARLELICSRCLESFVQDVECPVEECFSVIEKGIGTDFDPNIARIFLDSADEVVALMKAERNDEA